MSLLDEMLAGALTEAEAEALRELGLARDWSLEALQATPAATPAPLKSRLLAAIAAPSEALAPLGIRLAEVFDVTVDKARCYLQSVFDPAAWEDAIAEGIGLVHLVGGPATDGADVGFVRVASGKAFPHHAHVGVETSFILAGLMKNSDGQIYRPGDVIVLPADSQHSFESVGEDDLVFAVVVNGVTFGEGIEAP